MDWIEVTARTVEDAKELALDRLGVVEDELEYEVVDEARKGLFGIARGDARIRARVKPISREKPSDRKRRRRPGEHSQRSGQGGGVRGAGGGGGSGSSRGRRAGGRPASTRPDAGEGSQEANNPREARSTPARASDEGGGRRRRGGRGRGGGGGARAASAGEGTAEADDKVEAEVDVATVPVAD